MPPSTVTYFQMRLNLGVEEDKNLYNYLQNLPDRQRSTVVKVALLAYFRDQGTGVQERRTRLKSKSPESPLVSQHTPIEQVMVKPMPQIAPMELPVEAGVTQGETITSEIEEKARGLFGLLQ